MIYKYMCLTAIIAVSVLIAALFGVMVFMAISLFGLWSVPIVWLLAIAVAVIVHETLAA